MIKRRRFLACLGLASVTMAAIPRIALSKGVSVVGVIRWLFPKPDTFIEDLMPSRGEDENVLNAEIAYTLADCRAGIECQFKARFWPPESYETRYTARIPYAPL